MQKLREVLEQAQKNKVAVGHFNIGDDNILMGVFAAARELRVPVMVGVSEGERAFLGVRQVAALVKSLRDEFDFPIYLNADHTHSLAKALEAAKAGFDSIVFDLSALPFDENVRQTRDAVQKLKAINPDILVEGEIGDIGTGSEIHATAPDLTKFRTTPDEAKKFIAATGIDILAPAVGNMHGLVQSMVEGKTKKHLDIERIAAIKKDTGSLLTLHGGSGTDDDDFRRAIQAGINVVHINTELRLVWRNSLDASLAQHPAEVVPYKILPAVVEAIKQVALSRLRLFNEHAVQATSKSA
ncbi:MAG: class II fructose-bisphosphate aldolase [Candidatus Acidiferrales bacterium]